LTFEVDTEIQMIKADVVLFNDPTFTSIALDAYGYTDGEEGELIATSSTVLKTEMFESGLINLPFVFDPPLVARSGNQIAFKMVFSGYTYSDSSHVAWFINTTTPTIQLSTQAIGVRL
jgi:hypothetical protein